MKKIAELGKRWREIHASDGRLAHLFVELIIRKGYALIKPKIDYRPGPRPPNTFYDNS